MRKPVLVILTAAVVALAGEYGWGGFEITYVPGGEVLSGFFNIPNPAFDVEDFWNGVVCSGGMGFGGAPGMGYFGGGGFGGEREVSVSQDGSEVVYRISVGGGYGGFGKVVHFGPVSIMAFLGFGGVSYAVERKVNTGNTTLDDLKNGTLEGYLGASIDYTAIFPRLTVSLTLVKDFMQVDLGVFGMIGYSLEGWKVGDVPLEGVRDSNRFHFGYGLSIGVSFGT